MNFTVKELLWTLVFIIIMVFFIVGSTYSFMEYSKTGADWISALLSFNGNVIGGIAGGIVALLVAKYQIAKSKIQEEVKQKETTITMLKLIREEMRDNISVLNSCSPYNQDDYNLLKANLSDDTWKATMLHLNIPDDLLVKIHVSYKKVALIKHLTKDEIDDAVIESSKATVENSLDVLKEYLKENKIKDNAEDELKT
ncbi:hypothetical protein FZC78_02785 [Rossellomorea vietnamensis]|uniref:Uncharacterized protein n=1 Tax=Rossellomorea vietnamensis TaxID=218284 RepID=A0A5D4P104_9BACI|nr:hypothetical protein [Rossellomorea vietnamensis]TYS18482.1 hypothetical protein FZC78_02785 [Rossellomorea vietnamensis]